MFSLLTQAQAPSGPADTAGTLQQALQGGPAGEAQEGSGAQQTHPGFPLNSGYSEQVSQANRARPTYDLRPQTRAQP